MKKNRRWKGPCCRCVFNAVCAMVLGFLLYNQAGLLRNRFLKKHPSALFPLRSLGRLESSRRRDLEVALAPSNGSRDRGNELTPCSELSDHKGYGSKCQYLLAHPDCSAGGFFNYLSFFYCDCERFSFLGYLVLAAWVAALFYILGNTAADYFCGSLEKLSVLLNLSPAVAGVSLLPLGNGAPDVFASIASFSGKDAGDMGLNSVLGGAIFVTCVVAGIVSVRIADSGAQIEKTVLRDICFFLAALASLAVALRLGEIGVGGAFVFISVYAVYVCSVAAGEILRKHDEQDLRLFGGEEDGSVYASLRESEPGGDAPYPLTRLPRWVWSSNGGGSSDPKEGSVDNSDSVAWSRLISLLEAPLALPRRLTIPRVDDERWSKCSAVSSASLSPILLATLWSGGGSVTACVVGVFTGGALGAAAFLYTSSDRPPQRFLLAWALGGFLMCVVWFYLVGNELVAALAALGTIFGVNPSILGVTVLAWGNSVGDLVSNMALVISGGDGGVQTAVSGCYAGPMFYTVAGLGIPMVVGAWTERPAPYELPKDGSLVYTVGLLMAGLVWSLVCLRRNEMRPSKLLGVGLLAIYSTFIVVRVGSTIVGRHWML